jgi:DNA anti-recombination protein RmuC
VLNDDLLTNDELREFETQVDARFKAIAARFVMADERFIALGERLDSIQQELQALERRSEARCKTIERRIEASHTQLDHVRTLLASRIDHARRDLGRIVLLGLLGTTVSTAMVCLATIVLAL